MQREDLLDASIPARTRPLEPGADLVGVAPKNPAGLGRRERFTFWRPDLDLGRPSDGGPHVRQRRIAQPGNRKRHPIGAEGQSDPRGEVDASLEAKVAGLFHGHDAGKLCDAAE